MGTAAAALGANAKDQAVSTAAITAAVRREFTSGINLTLSGIRYRVLWGPAAANA